MQYQAAISTRTLLYNHIQKTWKILIENIAGDYISEEKEVNSAEDAVSGAKDDRATDVPDNG